MQKITALEFGNEASGVSIIKEQFISSYNCYGAIFYQQDHQSIWTDSLVLRLVTAANWLSCPCRRRQFWTRRGVEALLSRRHRRSHHGWLLSGRCHARLPSTSDDRRRFLNRQRPTGAPSPAPRIEKMKKQWVTFVLLFFRRHKNARRKSKADLNQQRTYVGRRQHLQTGF